MEDQSRGVPHLTRRPCSNRASTKRGGSATTSRSWPGTCRTARRRPRSCLAFERADLLRRALATCSLRCHDDHRTALSARVGCTEGANRHAKANDGASACLSLLDPVVCAPNAPKSSRFCSLWLDWLARGSFPSAGLYSALKRLCPCDQTTRHGPDQDHREEEGGDKQWQRAFHPVSGS